MVVVLAGTTVFYANLSLQQNRKGNAKLLINKVQVIDVSFVPFFFIDVMLMLINLLNEFFKSVIVFSRGREFKWGNVTDGG